MNDYNEWDIRYIGLAKHISKWSKDPNTQVGAVIVDERHVPRGIGFNGFPSKIKDDDRLYDREIKNKLMIHAEMNAFDHCDVSTKDFTLYSSLVPCSNCCLHIIQKGISRVVFPENIPERNKESYNLSLSLFKEANIYMTIIPNDIWMTL